MKPATQHHYPAASPSQAPVSRQATRESDFGDLDTRELSEQLARQLAQLEDRYQAFQTPQSLRRALQR